jgi:hypothetical protein
VSYGGTGDDIDGALISVNGRYPDSGFLVNEINKELVYVTSGTGKLLSRSGEQDFGTGDVIFIDNREEFAWSGSFEGFFATTPRFDPAQHKEVAE